MFCKESMCLRINGRGINRRIGSNCHCLMSMPYACIGDGSLRLGEPEFIVYGLVGSSLSLSLSLLCLLLMIWFSALTLSISYHLNAQGPFFIYGFFWGCLSLSIQLTCGKSRCFLILLHLINQCALAFILVYYSFSTIQSLVHIILYIYVPQNKHVCVCIRKIFREVLFINVKEAEVLLKLWGLVVCL